MMMLRVAGGGRQVRQGGGTARDADEASVARRTAQATSRASNLLTAPETSPDSPASPVYDFIENIEVSSPAAGWGRLNGGRDASFGKSRRGTVPSIAYMKCDMKHTRHGDTRSIKRWQAKHTRLQRAPIGGEPEPDRRQARG